MAQKSNRKAGRSTRTVGQCCNRLSVTRALGVSAILFLSVSFSAAGTAAPSQPDANQYRTTLLQLFDTAGEVVYLTHPEAIEAIDDAINQLDQITDEELRTLFMESLPIEELQQYIEELQPHLAAVRRLDGRETIQIPGITVDPPECESANPTVAIASQTVASIFEIILGTQKFLCLQEVLGENFAGLCTLFDVTRATLSSVALGENYCLAQKNLARNKAMLELTRGIGKHLNDLVDEETLTSRASQDALDAAQDKLDKIRTDTQGIQAALDSGYSQLDAQTAALMGAVTNLGNGINNLAALLDDISFRSTINLAFIEDASLRVADLQERAFDIQADVEVISATLADIAAAGAQLGPVLETEWSRQQRDRIAADLGNPNANSPGHALPSAAGGELELAREIVINTIFAMQALGGVDTSRALALVGMADDSYNKGQYPQAYLALKQAYQSLVGLRESR